MRIIHISLTFCLLLIISCNNQNKSSSTYAATKDFTSASSSDDADIKQAIHNAYAALTYRRNVDFDTAVAKKPFIPQSYFMHFDDNDSAIVENADVFFNGFKKMMKNNGIDSFMEEEVHTNIHHFGKVAQAFSSYKMYVNTKDTVAERGINSIQLLKTKDGWRVAVWIWYKQGNGEMLEPEYLHDDVTP